ncbi:MAG: hypothetical protein ACTHNY_02290 [Solirubrobacterales bacterium]
MKHLKILGLLTLAAASAASLMAFASSAYGAPTLTSPSGTEYTGFVEATLESGSSALLKAGVEDTCTSSLVAGPVITNNETHARGSVEQAALKFEKCNKDTATLRGGELTISPSGVVTATAFEVTVNDTSLGVSCIYGGGSGLTLGTLEEGTPAKLKVSTTKLKKISGSFFCASEGTWTANYVVTLPGTLLLS